MKLKKVLGVYKDSASTEHRKTIDEVKKVLKHCAIPNSFCHRATMSAQHARDCDLIISIGGDGTLLRVAHVAGTVPVLGVNSDPRKSEGALCNATRHDVNEKVAGVVDGMARMKRLTRARVSFKDTGCRYDALNEIYVGSALSYHTSRYVLMFGGAREEQKSSGVLVATGAGSSAWYSSAGKKNFCPELEELRFIVREPYAGKLARCTVTQGRLKAGVKLSVQSKMAHGIVAIDSIIEVPFHAEEKIEIRISPHPLMLVSF